MTCPLKVFLSHKVKEQGQAAKDFVNELRFLTDRDKLEIFMSPEITAGKRWDAEVHEQLKSSDVLILLYLTPSAVLDWCLYESGFFATAALDHSEKQLICVLPKGESAPGPLESWQNIEVTREGIRKLLKVLLNGESCPVKPELFSGDFAPKLDEVIDKLLTALGPGEKIRPLSHRVWITLPTSDEELRQNDRNVMDALLAGEFPIGTTFKGETEAFRQFGIDSDKEFLYSEFFERLEFKYALPLFTPILTNTMADILNDQVGPFSLPPIRVRDIGPAKSLVFAYLTERPNGKKTFEFVVHETPATAAFGKEDSFSILYKILSLALHFRRKVITQYGKKLEFMIEDSEKTEAFNVKASDLIKRITFDINSVLLDSMNRGLLSRGQIKSAFKKGTDDADKLSEIIDTEHGQWAESYQDFNNAAKSSNLIEANKAFDKMRGINKTMIALVTNRLSELVNEFK